MKIRAKLLVGFIVVALLCGIAGVIGITQLASLGNNIRELTGTTVPSLMALDRIGNDLRVVKASVNTITNPLIVDDAFVKAQLDMIAAARVDRQKQMDLYDAGRQTPQEQKLWGEFKASLLIGTTFNNTLIALLNKARALPVTIQTTTGTGASAKAIGTPNPERSGAFAQIADMIIADHSVDDTLAAQLKVQDYDEQHYTIENAKIVEDSANQAAIIVIIVTVLAFGAAIAIGLILGNSMSGSIRKIADRVGKISVGDLSQKLDARSKDELGELSVSVNSCIDNIGLLVTDAGMLSQAAVDGKLATRADATKHQGDYKRIVEGINKTLDAVINPINVTARYVDDISKGVIPPIITDTYYGDFNIIKNNLNSVVKMMSDLLAETDIIIRAAADGELDKRADAAKFLGGWKQLVAGVNDTITNIVDPLMVTADYVDKVSKGVIPPEITTVYKGQYNLIKTNLNAVVKMMSELLKETDFIVKAAADGELDKRADAAKFLGGWKQLVSGVNDTITNIVDPLMVTADYVDKVSKGVIPPEITTAYKGQYNLIKTNLNAVVKMMSELLKETDFIVKAAADGELDKRADATKFLGGWKQLVAGVNDTITNIVDPLMVTADYVDKVSKGVIPPEIATVYKGQYNIIKTNLNAVVKMMSELLKETDFIVKAAADGELDKRADAAKFLGGWKQLVSGVNDTITNIVDPLMVTADYVDKVSKGVIPPEITTVYKGQYNIIKTNLNAVVKMMSELLKETDGIIQAAADGELDKRANAGLFQGGWKQLVSGVNDTITNIVDPLMVTADYVDKVAKGVIPPEITTVYKGQYNIIKTNLNAVVKMMSELLKETDLIVKAAADGELDRRANADLFQGGWKQLVAGVNDTITNIVDPLMVTADYVDKVSKGVIPPEITTVYKGQYNLIKTNLNAVVKMMSELLSETDKLVKAAIAGQLDTRADAGKFLGGWNQLVKGVNETLAEVITPINETVAVLKRLADGDLTLRMAGEYKGDFDILKTALNDSLEAFNDTLRQVNIAVDQVAEGSLQVSQASQSLSQGATEQASSLEEITSSITEISSQTKVNTESAVTVNDLAKTAKNNAEQGNLQMQNLVAAMGDINKSAEEIKKIVKAIDDISFQINLLALNANVEAARAGKYGKGFAVVAEEVRNLAVRSANSVKDTTRMVDDTIANIERGNTLCDLTAKQLADIVGGAGQVATLAEEVATASKEQTQGLEQVSTGLNQIDQVTQANTASSEESASASEELSSQSQQVKSMLSRFKLKSKEGKLDNAELMQMLRAEMTKQGSGNRSGSPAAVIAQRPGPSNGRKAKVMAIDPSEVISLDDDNFGKF